MSKYQQPQTAFDSTTMTWDEVPARVQKAYHRLTDARGFLYTANLPSRYTGLKAAPATVRKMRDRVEAAEWHLIQVATSAGLIEDEHSVDLLCRELSWAHMDAEARDWDEIDALDLSSLV